MHRVLAERIEILTGPTEALVTAEELREWLGFEAGEQEQTLAALARAAVGLCGQLTGRQILRATLRLTLPQFPCYRLYIPKPPLVEVETVRYLPAAGGDWTTLAAEEYSLHAGHRPSIRPVTGWPATATGSEEAVRVDYVAGWQPPDVPEEIKLAVKLLVAAWQADREGQALGAGNAIPAAVDALLATWTVAGQENYGTTTAGSGQTQTFG